MAARPCIFFLPCTKWSSAWRGLIEREWEESNERTFRAFGALKGTLEPFWGLKRVYLANKAELRALDARKRLTLSSRSKSKTCEDEGVDFRAISALSAFVTASLKNLLVTSFDAMEMIAAIASRIDPDEKERCEEVWLWAWGEYESFARI